MLLVSNNPQEDQMPDFVLRSSLHLYPFFRIVSRLVRGSPVGQK
jgi:hypothetical protein